MVVVSIVGDFGLFDIVKLSGIDFIIIGTRLVCNVCVCVCLLFIPEKNNWLNL